MTVDKLIIKLQELSDIGKGNMEVMYYYDMYIDTVCISTDEENEEYCNLEP